MKNTTASEIQQEPGELSPDSTEFFGVEDFKARVDAALDGSDFDTTNPEVAQSIESYYADHYGLAAIVDSALEGTMDIETADFLVDSFDALHRDENGDSDPSANYTIASSAAKLAASVRDDLFGQSDDIDSTTRAVSQKTLNAAARCFDMLFREDSIGITTVGDPEIQILGDLHTKISQNFVELAETNGAVQMVEERDSTRIFYQDDMGIRRDRRLRNFDRVKKEVEISQQDFWNDVRYAGQFEFHNSGFIDRVYAAGGLMPRTEQVRHGREMSAQTESRQSNMHSNVPHFSEKYDPYSYKLGSPDSLEGPTPGTLAFPLAGIVAEAPFARDAKYAVVDFGGSTDDVPINEGVHEIGNGRYDQAGLSGQDRVFLASPTQTSLEKSPDQYIIPLGNPGKESDVIAIFNSDEAQTAMRLGRGENLPRIIQPEGENREVDVIALQAESIERYGRGRLVVPLRRGVFRYAAEGMSPDESAGREKARFNVNPTLQAAA